MPADPTELVCPVCGAATNNAGHQFSSLRALCLHMAGKAIGHVDEHRSWIQSHIPSAVLQIGNINPLATQIRFYVEEALESVSIQYEETDDPIEAAALLIERLDLESPTTPEGERTETELEKYLKAYSVIWDIENHLHRFAALTLGPKFDEGWWLAFPGELQYECLTRFNRDGKRASLDCYINLQEFSGIVKENKSEFETAFERLRSSYSDPKSFFHNNLADVNQIRNDVMHPLKRLTPSYEALAQLEEFAAFVRKFTES